MVLVDNLTDDASQVTQVVLDDSSVLQLTLNYRAATQRWTVDVSHALLAVAGINICVYPNLLREWRNLIPFGIACTTTTGLDPTDVEDFVNGNAALYVLNNDDEQEIEVNVFGGSLQ